MFIQSNIPAHVPVILVHTHKPHTALGSSLGSAWHVLQKCPEAKVCALGIKSSIMTGKVSLQCIRIQQTQSNLCLTCCSFCVSRSPSRCSREDSDYQEDNRVQYIAVYDYIAYFYSLAFALATKDCNSNRFLWLVFYFLIPIDNLYWVLGWKMEQ